MPANRNRPRKTLLADPRVLTPDEPGGDRWFSAGDGL
jgi:hypothetical protein